MTEYLLTFYELVFVVCWCFMKYACIAYSFLYGVERREPLLHVCQLEKLLFFCRVRNIKMKLKILQSIIKSPTSAGFPINFILIPCARLRLLKLDK